MTVKDNRVKTVTFSSLRIGDAFIYNKDVYIALPNVKFCGISNNAFNLNDEFLASFEDDTPVVPVNIEIIIN